MTLTPRDGGWIEVICGPMFCGKTEELIRRLRRAQIAKMKTAIFKPLIDDRYSEEHIVSHNQMKMESYLIDDAAHILKKADGAEVVGIDEAQFLGDNLVDVCQELSANKKRVVVAGLDKDYLARPFGPMPEIMCAADYLDKLRAICIICGEPAGFTQRLSADADQVVIGETDKYEARCRSCYFNKKDN
ncbi:MAG: thymidine kinase [Candidatus Marinimicrobia bacterium]|nr:thymidine kinase [Candidatus Neomarinimicrobiota bacterium]MDP6275702.1 thymidine kinase [Candidatus Neomarinimicrobiota bacterium]MDP7331072.1 thymidine kinase [Candidatus Neomarinimicrobiota bacterium]HBN45491.1 thymidine kinase [Candidatus Neomarinimicrobiota bacterium]HJL74483.1 thymidine kinase [Candidatus Neomarinimicrobiota bacterium]|tara:strand:- start:4096 stop:4659 length:564 start_codon:yes stop_codon:yes gene_type:complete